ncbi:hypothetical protein [Calditerricola satsumensis]|uniref:hypothetical protein n=1 Tax=Calditerricola satsumensis TaxID=373054 RepID=UPI0006D22648|nr:hypothetical protein [Calditerricola satsumensis]
MVRNWITFNALRTLCIPGVRYIKPEHFLRHREEIRAASWILFPEHWQVNVLVYAWKKRIFPSAATLHLGHSKVEMTRAFWAVCPEHVPYTEILANTETNVRAVLDTFPFPFIAKEVRSSPAHWASTTPVSTSPGSTATPISWNSTRCSATKRSTAWAFGGRGDCALS